MPVIKARPSIKQKSRISKGLDENNGFLKNSVKADFFSVEPFGADSFVGFFLFDFIYRVSKTLTLPLSYGSSSTGPARHNPDLTPLVSLSTEWRGGNRGRGKGSSFWLHFLVSL